MKILKICRKTSCNNDFDFLHENILFNNPTPFPRHLQYFEVFPGVQGEGSKDYNRRWSSTGIKHKQTPREVSEVWSLPFLFITCPPLLAHHYLSTHHRTMNINIVFPMTSQLPTPPHLLYNVALRIKLLRLQPLCQEVKYKDWTFGKKKDKNYSNFGGRIAVIWRRTTIFLLWWVQLNKKI